MKGTWRPWGRAMRILTFYAASRRKPLAVFTVRFGAEDNCKLCAKGRGNTHDHRFHTHPESGEGLWLCDPTCWNYRIDGHRKLYGREQFGLSDSWDGATGVTRATHLRRIREALKPYAR